jgi:hypothetical protein
MLIIKVPRQGKSVLGTVPSVQCQAATVPKLFDFPNIAGVASYRSRCWIRGQSLRMPVIYVTDSAAKDLHHGAQLDEAHKTGLSSGDSL